MSLRRVWRRVRTLRRGRERTHNLLAISDLHLGADLRLGTSPHKLRPRHSDRALVSFLDWHAANRTDGKPWRLILNGDIVDFVAITAVPAPGEPVAFTVSPEERELGLSASAPKCVWKLQRTMERHADVFDALGRFLQKGNSLHIVRGNHDTEWRFPAVQEALRARLSRAGASPHARQRAAARIHFHDWFYYEPGWFYAEHGHAHDRYCVQSDFFQRDVAPQEMELPLSSKVMRYFVNRYTEQVEVADDVDAWGVKEYLDWVLKAGNPLRVAADYFVMVFRVINPVVRQSLRFSRAVARAAGARRRGTPRREKLLAVASRPAEQSLFDSMQLFYLDRMALALLCLVAAFTLFAEMRDFWAKAGAITLVGILFAAVNALLGAHRHTDAHPLLLAAARRVAQIFDVRIIAMGHSHRPVDEALGNGVRYLNTGSWTGRGERGFPHVCIEGRSASLRFWEGRRAAEPLPVGALVTTA